jgi:hypothetical protein
VIKIFMICGFYNLKSGHRTFQRTNFETWVHATFERGAVEVTLFKKKTLIKIGHGEHPKRWSDQEKEKLDPPRFQDSKC